MVGTDRLHAHQVNYVGPYMLTRLLEPCLRAAGHARVVNVSSVTHRYGVIGNPAAFLSRSTSTVGGQYPVRTRGLEYHALPCCLFHLQATLPEYGMCILWCDVLRMPCRPPSWQMFCSHMSYSGAMAHKASR